MIRHRSFRHHSPGILSALFLLLSLSLMACQQQGGGGGGGGSSLFGGGPGGTSGGGGDYSDIFGGGSGGTGQFPLDEEGTMDMGAGFESASNSLNDTLQTLEQSGQGDPQQIQGFKLAADALERFASVFGQITPGMQPSQIQPLLPLLADAKQHAYATAQYLWQMGLAQLAELFFEEASKVEIFRFYHPTAYRHYYTKSSLDGYIAQVAHGFLYEGVAFRVYRKERHECKRLLTQCYNAAANNHFLHLNDCAGFQQVTRLGYICAKQQPYARNRIHRMYHPIGDHLITVSPAEVDYAGRYSGYQYEFVMGHAPN